MVGTSYDEHKELECLPCIRQDGSQSCWAAATAMIVSWYRGCAAVELKEIKDKVCGPNRECPEEPQDICIPLRLFNHYAGATSDLSFLNIAREIYERRPVCLFLDAPLRHFVVVAGYRRTLSGSIQDLKVMDPAVPNCHRWVAWGALMDHIIVVNFTAPNASEPCP